ncbi:hypothetical protein [Clostridium chauvoei]|uniref:Uncharacterized protein n=3 Tax=Clostridium chauvoei TaxID=46867 RepID=S6EYS3_9CLOT|nr:hypothetical protein [Clostridium chauvoei]ATD54803.1 hypothetical protein BTM20_05960 [Clostridium chauvoei]ATD57516.1 hypothetical protein BTM21_07095 [Clostridium chauvoei]MBX7281194.1 hypothetical protein [Clostridium chauvoei]MBX7283630.1 hypothetical protein [Clostridium chauvoei]MBX7286238.1 hypothetical protein [Clostridium chauvoei]
MYLIKNIKQIFDYKIKEFLALSGGLTLIFLLTRLDNPEFIDGYMIAILITISMIGRYNFVSEHIVKEDYIYLKKYKATLKYIISKNIVTLLLVISLVFIVFLLEFIITRATLSYEFYFESLILSILTIAFNNISFMFNNKTEKSTSDKFDEWTSIVLGFKSLINSLPSILIVFIILYFNKYLYNINLYDALIVEIMSIILLNFKLKNQFKVNLKN